MKQKTKVLLILGFLLAAVLLAAARIRFHHQGLQREELHDDILAEASGSALPADGAEPSHIAMDMGDMVTVDAEVAAGTGTYGEYAIQRTDFPAEKGEALLEHLSGKKAAKRETDEDGYYLLETEDGSYVCNNRLDIFYGKNDPAYTEVRSILEMWDEHYTEQRSQKDLGFASLDECCQQVLDLMKNFTNEECRILHATSFAAEQLDALQQQMVEDERLTSEETIDMSPFGDMYLIYATLVRDDTPMYSIIDELRQFDETEENMESECCMMALISEEGLLCMEMNNPFSVTAKNEDVQIISAKEALEKGTYILRNSLSDESITVNKIFLEYVPLSTQKINSLDTLRPYWVIQYRRESVGWDAAIRVNAKTGENLAYGK